MSFEAQFLKLMPYTVTLKAPTGRDAQGQPTYVGATPLSFRARIFGPLQDLRKDNKSERAELYTVWVASGSTEITPEWQLTLPATAPWSGRTPLLFSVSFVTDDKGMHHSKLTCGFMYHRQGQT